VREAHPTDEWQMKSNTKEKDNVCYAQPKTLEQRIAIANDFTQRFKYTVPFGVDEMNNAANDAYAAWPERLYVLDENGRVSYKGGNGPFYYDPKEVRDWLAKRYGEVKHPEPPPAAPATPAAPAAPADEKKS
jgi:type I thyroxine 5'-deiodinase